MGILLKSQYTIKQANSSDKLAKSSSPDIPYIGPYVLTVFNQRYEGDSIRNKGESLVNLVDYEEQKGGEKFLPYDRIKPKIKASSDLREPVNTLNPPTPSQIKKGSMIRYFFLDQRTKTFIETNKKEYNKRNEIDLNIYTPYIFKWFLSNGGFNRRTVTAIEKLGYTHITPYDYISERNEETPYTQ
jgi:hypothetical protein